VWMAPRAARGSSAAPRPPSPHGASIECQYSAAGPFTIRGTSGEAPTLLQSRAHIVQVPHVAPSAVRIEVLQGSDCPSTVNRSGTVPVFNHADADHIPGADQPAGHCRPPRREAASAVLDTLDLNTTALQWRRSPSRT